MNQHILEELCQAATGDTLTYTPHYLTQANERPTPSKPDVVFMLCRDAPEVIEDTPERDTLLIWGTSNDGRIGHVLCSYYPVYQVITAYFPGETEPHKWESSDYRIRRRVVEK